MTQFLDFLRSKVAHGGLPTEDILTVFLPLARQVLDCHREGQVAALEGVEHLAAVNSSLLLDEHGQLPIRHGDGRLAEMQAHWQSPIDVLSETEQVHDLDAGSSQQRRLDVVDRDASITRPVYLPDYVTWEHAIEVHDPITDVFSLGLILASLACGLDFSQQEDLERWVEHRRNLFALSPSIHPVIAQAIFRMTELDRTRRSQDLSSVIYALENYRDQTVDIEFDLSTIPGFETQEPKTRQSLILSHLRERLFDLTRRNRLLNFQNSLHTVNLTQGSVPLSFNLKDIRADQIMVWNQALSDRIAAGRPISLNKYLNFAEAIYLPPLLDRLIADSRRDLAEYGFVQLRLVACFLRWANVKESPPELYQSPLVLIPVQLRKQKGIRDTYELLPQTESAEINPVIRHLFQQLYAIDLPESIDLSQSGVEALFDVLRQQIHASEPAVELRLVDRPQVDLIHEKARRKLEQYRRRARRYAKGQRTYAELDYSYDPANYEPLGIRMFREYVRPQRSRMDAIIASNPQPFAFASEPEKQIETTKSFAQIKSDSGGNPYHWEFDLCNLTLANFKYRKMSLVRDYDALLQDAPDHAVFDAIFETQSAISPSPPDVPELDERADILPCDPTQSTAIARARKGESYIIQGPPGTGKSQTIANLIADYVSRGQRVLFVCEKRAAIDVVFARLKQCGIGDLACLIHDTQADKREFVHNLREGFEQLTTESQSASRTGERRRAVREIRRELEPLQAFNDLMLSCTNETGITVREVIERFLSLESNEEDRSSAGLDLTERERLPNFATWHACRQPLDRLQRWIDFGNSGRPLAEHPFRRLSPQVVRNDYPINLVSDGCDAALETVRELETALSTAHWQRERWATANDLRRITNWAEQVLPMARAGRLELVASDSEQSEWYNLQHADIDKARQHCDECQSKNEHWIDKFSAQDTEIALQQVSRLEKSWWRWFSPAWWSIRQQLNRRYRFAAHPVRPTGTQVLETLQQEYEARRASESLRETVAKELGWSENFDDANDRIRNAQQSWQQADESLTQETLEWFEGDDAVNRLIAWVDVGRLVSKLAADVDEWMESWEDCELESWLADLRQLPNQIEGLPDFLECLRIMGDLPTEVRNSLREYPLSMEQFEREIASASLDSVMSQHREVATFNGRRRDDVQQALAKRYRTWLKKNALVLKQQVARVLWQAVKLAETAKREVEPEKRDERDILSKGLKELNREFKKSMRYRSIRDLVADESGQMIKLMKPVWLMSPLSVSDALPLDPSHFDVVIFDEASQITLEEAVPSLFRARQAIVVGDEKQMPPTQFFRAKVDDDPWADEGEEQESLGLEESSFLSHCTQALPSTLLGWHYRSRNESLISFSNWSFYAGRLLTAPEETLPRADLPDLSAESAADARESIEGTLSRAVSFHRLRHGCYEGRRNRAEAEYIAELVRALLEHDNGLTLGIVAFSEAQQDEIDAALERLARHDPEFRDRLDQELDREDDGQFVGLLVKNLENIQGDERDLMILSVCYGPDPDGRIRMHFGPINQGGGEKRLNVAFSRAKHHMVVVSSMLGGSITNDYNPGALALKNYLLYAESISRGDREAAQRILRSAVSRTDDEVHSDPWGAGVAEDLTEWLSSLGFVVDRDVGQSKFKCDLAIRRPEDSVYRLGILIDGKAYYDQGDLLERDLMRPKLLHDFGWQVAIVLGKDWWDRREDMQAELLKQLERPHPADSSSNANQT